MSKIKILFSKVISRKKSIYEEDKNKSGIFYLFLFIFNLKGQACRDKHGRGIFLIKAWKFTKSMRNLVSFFSSVLYFIKLKK